MSRLCRLSSFAALSLALVQATPAAILSDSQLFFDPASLPRAVYPERGLSSLGSINFSSSPGREIVGASILPALHANTYGPGYAYSYSDYDVLPNQPSGRTYSADLSGGALTMTFGATGIYHARVNYSDGSAETYRVPIGGGWLDASAAADAPIESSPYMKTPIKEGDLFIVSTGAEDDDAMTNAVASLGGAGNVVRASSADDVVNAIAQAYADQGHCIRAVIVGHGFQGSIRMGHGASAERINNTGNNNTMSGSTFGALISKYACSVNLVGCSTGGGTAGADLLNSIQDGSGGAVMASAYTSTLYVDPDAWYLETWGSKVPTPGSTLLAATGLVLVARRRGTGHQ